MLRPKECPPDVLSRASFIFIVVMTAILLVREDIGSSKRSRVSSDYSHVTVWLLVADGLPSGSWFRVYTQREKENLLRFYTLPRAYGPIVYPLFLAPVPSTIGPWLGPLPEDNAEELRKRKQVFPISTYIYLQSPSPLWADL